MLAAVGRRDGQSGRHTASEASDLVPQTLQFEQLDPGTFEGLSHALTLHFTLGHQRTLPLLGRLELRLEPGAGLDVVFGLFSDLVFETSIRRQVTSGHDRDDAVVGAAIEWHRIGDHVARPAARDHDQLFQRSALALRHLTDEVRHALTVCKGDEVVVAPGLPDAHPSAPPGLNSWRAPVRPPPLPRGKQAAAR